VKNASVNDEVKDQALNEDMKEVLEVSNAEANTTTFRLLIQPPLLLLASEPKPCL